MAELLVAMAIFAVLVAGIATLFTAAIGSARNAREVSKAYEQGRVALGIMERDLTAAFTAREQAQTQQFYGQPDGYMFVGRLEATSSGSGSTGLCRSTFVIHPSISTEVFETQLVEAWGVLRGHVQEQARHRAEIAGADAEAAMTDARALFDAMYPLPAGGDNGVIEVPVRVTTNALLHIVEPGKSDLEDFDLPKLPSSPATAPVYLEWPYISLELPSSNYETADNFVFSQANNPSLSDEDKNVAAAIKYALYLELISAINPSAKTQTPGTPAFFAYDLRRLIWAVPGLNTLGTDAIQSLLAAKKREIWIRILSEDPTLLYGSAGAQAVIGNTCWIMWGAQGRQVGDFVLAERILRTAQILDSRTGDPVWMPPVPGNPLLEPMDALYLPGIFQYGNGNEQFDLYFNDCMNVNAPSSGGLSHLQYARIAQPTAANVQSFDKTLTEMKQDQAVTQVLGSPMDPRLPYLVSQQFYVMSERPLAGSSDVRKWFSQVITLPSGFSRSANSGG